jgi:hypothetical protein
LILLTFSRQLRKSGKGGVKGPSIPASTLGRLPRNVTAIIEMSMVVLDRPSHHDHAAFGGGIHDVS